MPKCKRLGDPPGLRGRVFSPLQNIYCDTAFIPNVTYACSRIVPGAPGDLGSQPAEPCISIRSLCLVALHDKAYTFPQRI